MNENWKFPQSTNANTTTRWFRKQMPKTDEVKKDERNEEAEHASARIRNENETANLPQRSSLNAFGNVVNRIVANPRVTKTQVAKIKYVPELSKSPSKKSVEAEIGSHIITSLAPETFQQKKIEREKDIEEIKNMLSEIGEIGSKPQEALSLKENPYHPPPLPHHSPHSYPTALHSNTPYGDSPTKKVIEKMYVSNGTSTAPNTYRRCRTEISIDRPKSASTNRGSSCQIEAMRGVSTQSRSCLIKSQENLHTENGCLSKKRTYDPIEARRFMKEQKKKRRIDANISAGQQAAFEKEQIKKRLEELNKNSRKIVTNNLRKQRPCGTNTDAIIPQQYADKLEANKPLTSQLPATHEVLSGNVDFQNKNSKNLTNNNNNNKIAEKQSNITKIESTELNETQQSNKKSPRADVSELTGSTNTPSTTQEKLPPSEDGIIESQRRVGLLRKPGLKDHSFSAIKEFSFDKENVALEMMTPKIPSLSQESRKDINSTAQSRDLSIQTEPSAKNWQKSELPTPANSQRNGELQKLLEKSTQVCNNPSLHDNTSQHNFGLRKEEKPPLKKPQDATDLPFWLRPSAVQIYPYNFIQAVRRKLQSTVNPPPTEIIEVASIKNQTTSTRDLSALNKVNGLAANEPKEHLSKPSQTLESKKQHSPHKKEREEIPIPKTHKKKESHTKSPSKLQSISDFNSNFSSISLQLPNSNTISEVSSLKSESICEIKSKTQSPTNLRVSVHGDDDTTVSSSIFSSPEKRCTTTATTSNLNASKERINDINFVVPKAVSPLSLERIDKLKINSKRLKSEKHKPEKITPKESTDNINVTKLLKDFNQGLSQVIEVNEQLRSTLDRSQQIISTDHTVKSQTNATSQKEYSTDFEESSRTRNSHGKHSHKIFQTVTPSLSSPKSTSQGVTIAEFELNLDSVTPSIHTSELTDQTASNSQATITATDHTPQTNHTQQIEHNSVRSQSISPRSHEERLATIDQLKENLRRMIKNSRAKRSAVDQDQGDTSNRTQTISGPPVLSSLESKHKPEHRHSHSHHKKSSKHVSRDVSKSASKSPSPPNTHEPKSTVSTTNQTVNTSILSQNGVTTVALTTTTFSYSDVMSPTRSNAITSPSNNKLLHSKSKNETISSHIISEDLNLAYEAPSSQNNKIGNTRKTKSKHHQNHLDQETFIKTHINTSRGEQITENSDDIAPPSYVTDISMPKKKSKSPTPTKAKATAVGGGGRGASPSGVVKSRHREMVPLLRDFEIPQLSSHDGSISESSLNYSNVGLYEQLIKSETTKSEYLSALLRMREKSLLDRTKGQIAWLEVQKERYKSKGLLLQIAAIRKKQRSILIKMERERDEIKRVLQSTESLSSNLASSRLRGGTEHSDSPHRRNITITLSPTVLPIPLPKSAPNPKPLEVYQRKRERSRSRDPATKPSSAPILRANYELESSTSLEELLRQREEDLRKRREHVEHLMKWHQKLDEEEADVLHLENILFSNTGASTSTITLLRQSRLLSSSNIFNRSPKADRQQLNIQQSTISAESGCLTKRTDEMERRLKEIDKSLRELNNISVTTTPMPACSTIELTNGQNSPHSPHIVEDIDYVRTTGSKLNKLWRRLTSQHTEKYEPNRRYKLCKSDLERLYEDAKRAVLNDFAHAEQRSLAAELFERSTSISQSTIGSAEDIIKVITAESISSTQGSADVLHGVTVPSLNLNFSTSQSEEQEEEQMVEASQADDATFTLPKSCTQAGDYSPSAAERCFQSNTATPVYEKSVSSLPSESTSQEKRDRTELMKRNMRKFLKLTTTAHNIAQPTEGIERSLSDTEIATGAKVGCRGVVGASQCSLWAAHQKSDECHTRTVRKERIKSPTSAEVSADTLQSVASLKTLSGVSTTSQTSLLTLANIPFNPNSPQNISNDVETCQNLEIIKIDQFTESTIETSSNAPSYLGSDDIETATVIHSVGVTAVTLSKRTYSDEAELNTSQEVESVLKTVSPVFINQLDSNERKTCSPTVTPTLEDTSSSDFEHQSKEIAAKLNEISEAVARLSQSDLHTSSISQNNEFGSNTASQEVTSLNNNDSHNSDFSYSTTFESPNRTAETETALASNIENKNHTSQIPKSDEVLRIEREVNQNQSETENRLLDGYELDFECTNDETILEDVTMPCFDTSFDTTNTTQILEDIDANMDVNLLTKDEIKYEAKALPTTSTTNEKKENNNAANMTNTTITDSVNNNDNSCQNQSLQQQLMPDIINELEIKRCQQILLENEQLRQHVTAVPYMFVREIPNKPPPPYCPPAHGSPMTTIFPSEERIKDITYRRTHELYCEVLKTDHVNEKGEKLPSVLDEQITNIYERIILDICREYLVEHKEVLTQGDPTNFHSQLAFFNPPDRLRCIQESIYKEVRRCLAMDKTSPKRTPVYSIYGQRAKRDHIGKIIIQEMYEENDKWCNFHLEEDEVLDLIIEEMIESDVCEIARAVLNEEMATVKEFGTVQQESELEMLPQQEVEKKEINEVTGDEISASTAESTNNEMLTV